VLGALSRAAGTFRTIPSVTCLVLALAVSPAAHAKPSFQGIGFLPGGKQSAAASVSRDVIAGYGTNPTGKTEGWVAKLR
jgi:hypothetical protein